MAEIFPVAITLGDVTRRFSPAFQRDPAQAEDWKQTLLHAHGQAVVRCCCKDDDLPRRLSIRYRSDNDSFHLARFPETGHQHDPDCGYYAPDPASSGRGGYRPGVVEETAEGGLRVKLAVGLQRRAAVEKPPVAKKKAAGSDKSGKPAMTLLGLLHLMWTVAGFNRWSPGMKGKRNLGLIGYHLARAARGIKAGRTHLSEAVLLATMQSGGKQEEANAERTAQAVRNERRLIAVAPLARYKLEYDEAIERPPIMGFGGFPFLILDPQLWNKTCDRYAATVGAWRDQHQVVSIMQFDVPRPQPGGRYLAEVLDIALMRVTGDWIPVDSGHEARVCDALVLAGRRFEKPLQYDADEDATFPDFWLQDLGRDYPMEVWGMNTPEYLARKAAKTEHYDATYGPQPAGWWGWDAASGMPMTDIPGDAQ